MTWYETIYKHWGVVGFALLILSGCVTTPRVPIKLDPTFSELQIESVVLLPVVDRRVDKSYDMDFEEKIRIPAKEMLEEKGYSVVVPDSFREGSVVQAGEVAGMDVNGLALLGPDDARAIILIYIEDVLSSYKVMSYAFKIEATASMIAKEKQVELWRDKGIGRAGQGGLISGMFQAWDRSTAIKSCLSSLFKTLPKVSTDR